MTTKPWLRFLAPLAWMGFLFLLSSQAELPHPRDPFVANAMDTVAHFSVYGILALLLRWAFAGINVSGWQASILSLVLAAAYGASDEFHQSLVPYRVPSPVDWLTDVAGAAWALWMVSLAGQRLRADVSPSGSRSMSRYRRETMRNLLTVLQQAQDARGKEPPDSDRAGRHPR